MPSPDQQNFSDKIASARVYVRTNRYHLTWILPLTGSIIGFIYTHQPLGGLLFAFFGFVLSFLILKLSEHEKISGIYGSSEMFDNALIVLVAAVIQADQKISKEELTIVEKKLKNEYFTRDYTRLVKKLKTELAKNAIDFELNARFIHEEFSASEKVHLLHLLVKIALADGLLTIAEESILQQITAKIGVPYRTLDSLLAVHRFRREQAENNQQRTKTVPFNQLENAYKILEIDATATNQEIKKAYKKLAIIHHPDKVAHLGEHLQKNAAEKFKIIVGAYDLICKKRGIV